MSAKVSKFPPPAHMTQAEVILYLHKQVFRDAVAAGWLAPAVRKTSGHGVGSVFYRWADVQDVSLRISGGEYPGEGAEDPVKRGRGRPCKTAEVTA